MSSTNESFQLEAPKTYKTNAELLQEQKKRIAVQDESLTELSLAAQRIKEISNQINNELTKQDKVIGEVEDDIETTREKVKQTTKKVKEVHRKTKGGCIIT